MQQWLSLPEYLQSLEKAAVEKGERFRANRIKDHLPRIPAAPKLQQIQSRLAASQEILTLGAWVDCVQGLTCQLVVGPTGPPYVTGE